MGLERAPSVIVDGNCATLWDGVVHRYTTVASTMDEARALAAAGAPHGTVVVAREQTGGRGRNGRTWISPPGNLHATFLLRPDGPPQHAPQLAFVMAVAVASAIDRLAGPGTGLKWPNDVMRGAAKLAGILLERLDNGAVLAGVGVNVRHVPSGMPYPVTSLAALGCGREADDVLTVVVAALKEAWSGWGCHGLPWVLARWSTRGPMLGDELLVRAGAEVTVGRYGGLRADGALLLDTAAGRRVVVAGDVQPCAALPNMAKTVPC